MVQTILFVCTGNTCRSSMAQALANKISVELGYRDQVQFFSAGTAAFPGASASDQAIAVMAQQGIDLSSHRATPLTREMVMKADLILTMTRRQKQHVLDMLPEAAGKVFTLKEYVMTPEKLEEIEKQIKDIKEKLAVKREGFLQEYGPVLAALEEKRNRLTRELEEVEVQLQDIYHKLSAETADETRAIEQLEREIEHDILDPFGLPQEFYQECAAELEKSLRAAIRRIAGTGKD